MGRPSDEFWILTYREIHACVDQYMDDREERLMLFGTDIATQLNIATQGKTTHSWTDIFQSRHRQIETSRRTAAQLSDEMRLAHALWQRANGTVN